MQIEAFEVNNGQILVKLLQILSNSQLSILVVFLLQQAYILEELSHTTISDILNHLLWQTCSFLLGYFLLDATDVVSLLLLSSMQPQQLC